MGNFPHVKINFATSHLIFPTIIGTILVLLGIAILLTHHRAILGSGGHWRATFGQMDKLRFFGTILLTVVYFLLMPPVGDLWPNTGLGFLICSVPYVLLIGLLYMHERPARSVGVLALVALVVPTLVWWLFTDLFFLTLP